MAIKIKRATWLSGEPLKVGEIIQADDESARTLIELGHAESTKAELTQPAKPTFTREKSA